MRPETRSGQLVHVREETRQVVFAMQVKAEHRWRSFADCDIIIPDVGVAMRKAKAQEGAPCVAREIHRLRTMWSTAMSEPTRKACAYCLFVEGLWW